MTEQSKLVCLFADTLQVTATLNAHTADKMNFLRILSSFALIALTYAIKNIYLNNDDKVFEASAAGRYATSGNNIPDIAVFLLGTFRDAEQFGEHDFTTQRYYDRVVAARMTW